MARLTGLTKHMDGHAVIDNLQCEVGRGEIVCLLGANGSGKTVLIELLLGLLIPDEGTVELFGDVSAPPYPRDTLRRIGVVLEHPGLYGYLTVVQNLTFFARLYGIDDRTSRIRDLLDVTGLWQRRHDKADSLSRGLRQRAAIARALLHRPELVVLDEPTAGLDGEAVRATWTLVAELVHESQSSAILASPRIDEVEAIGHRAVVLDHGRVVVDASITDVARLARGSAEHASSPTSAIYRRLLAAD